MCRTGGYRFGFGNWIFLLAIVHLFTYVQGGEEQPDAGVQFVSEPTDAVVGQGARAVLSCSARGPPGAPSAGIHWRYRAEAPPASDHVLHSNDRYRSQASNGSLLLTSMSAALAGHYQCVASVDGVGTVVSRVAIVFLAEPPEVGGGPRSVLSGAGGAVLLPCGIRAGPRLGLRVLNAGPPDRRVYGAHHKQHAPVPTLTVNVTWLKDGSPLALEPTRMALTPSGALEIDPVRAQDAARYVCSVAVSDQPPRAGEPTELSVSAEVGGAESPPRFIVTPQPATVVEGASVTFDCAAAGNPKPEMTWLNNGVAIDLSDLDSRFYLVGSGSLRVQSARALDAGSYTCRAHNRLDSADHGTQLHVLAAPRVTLPRRGPVTAVTRGDVTLSCSARGRPPPVLAWLKDGEPITPNQHDITLVDGRDLRIQGVLGVDAGMFQCAANSPAGSSVASLRLLVAPPADDAPEPPARPPTDAELSPLVPPLPGPDPRSLGETSSAFTPEPDSLDFDYDSIGWNSLHAAEGLDPEPHAPNTTAPPPPPAPSGLKAVLVKHRFVTLTWEEPAGTAAGEVTGYAVVYRVVGSQRERVVRSSSGRREMNVPSLQPNTTYLFRVVALTDRGPSPPTEAVEARTPPEEFAFGPPTALRVEHATPHSLALTWRPPDPRPDSYRLQYTEVESGREQWQSVEGGATAVTVGGLRAGAEYVVRVAGAGGAPGRELRVRTPSDAPAAPPGNVTVIPASATSLLVRWEAPPARAHRGPLTGYKVRYRAMGPPPAPGAAPPAPRRKAESLTTPADARRAELRGLDGATTYQVRVCAINANGSGPFSEWVSATTSEGPRDTETAAPDRPPALRTRAGRDWISVWWSPDEAPGSERGPVLVRGYSLSWGLGVPDDHVRALPAHAHSHVIRQLQSNSEYVISLRASNALGPGPAVYATVRTRAPPLEGDEGEEEEGGEEEDEEEDGEGGEEDLPPLIPPVGLKVIMLSGSTAVVYWTDPTLPKGQTATDGRRYSVRWAAGAGGAGGGRPRYFNATDLNCMIDELKPHTTYDFAVKLHKGGRESAWSLLVSNTTLEAPPGSPPRDLRLTAAASRSLDVSWSPPARANGLVTGYVVMYAAQGPGAEWAAVTVTGDRRGTRLDRLRPGTAYLVKVQARNSEGLGPFTAPLGHTTPDVESGGGALSGATGAWLWASAGGACAVMALAAALALSLCCRRHPPPLHLQGQDRNTYQKSSASAAIKPPDLWIHHDQMELKRMDKSLHSSAISAGSVDTGAPLMSSTLTLTRAPPGEYEPARLQPPPPGSVDRRHYVPTYVESRRSPSCAGSDDTAVLRASPASPASAGYVRCVRCDYKPMSSVGCASSCERRAPLPRPALPHPDQSTPLLSGPLCPVSPQSSLASLHPPPAPCGSGSCPLGAACGGVGSVPVPGGDVYAVAARERGHYVAYEPLGHYTHRDSLSSDVGAGGGAGAGGSLQRRAGGGAGPGGALHSFTLPSDASSDRSTPSHGRGGARESSPYKKSATSSPGRLPDRLGTAPELEPLTPSRSTERLHREMANLEGLMKDLSAITQQQYHC